MWVTGRISTRGNYHKRSQSLLLRRPFTVPGIYPRSPEIDLLP